ncbi:hypothetical protein A3A46_04020 [Candidatus Roizmanbacteria bacterium RIFCSPLOWO2_01_FULL_37_13]|uniref:Pyruvate carboxyltransferase domain-containing protein n=1 Tax=Candidatus Roizmanbacteria bacterium RIFCSPHIGHO2_02_FULL_38_11 TaxID=1802039 RepID=A0A1F7H1W4_9BACT|nr:MAG: hypothetical protein A3C25_03420 [Candidatus Roizmanbacteria bacterium RIFCSPHIGHO2_02_FULL_38_11]OGK40944.1 MAG: hypothetical protein A3A46_04020 [Candidatus Roizmanbacteria bacterium RIFCSPLOWO2_01_FULL_37_13]
MSEAPKMSSTLWMIKAGNIPLDFNWSSDLFHDIPIPVSIPAEPTANQVKRVELVAEDLRDGLGGVKIYPDVKAMLDYVGLLEEFGVKRMTVGIYTGENSKTSIVIKSLLAGMRDGNSNVIPIVLSLATEESLRWTLECKEINPELEAIVFMGTAPVRLLVEGWDKSFVLDRLSWAVKEATNHGVKVIGATEHTTQTPPDFLSDIVKAEIDNGASAFCIADTIGIARPRGVYRIVNYVRELLNKFGADSIPIEWHGHRDLGNDLWNAMAAISAGADRVHTVALGIGERAGNTQLEPLILNFIQILREANMEVPWKTKMLEGIISAYCALVDEARPNHGPSGLKAFQTQLGIHASAILKAELLAREAKELGLDHIVYRLDLMRQTIYSSVFPPSIGRANEVLIGPLSGSANVKLYCLYRGIDLARITEAQVKQVLYTAKQLGRVLTPEEVDKLLNHQSLNE